MKKKLIILLLTSIMALTMTAAAFAAEQEDAICQIAKNNKKITDAKCVIYARTCIIALKTDGFVNKSEYTAFKNKLIDDIKTQFDNVDNVFVTRSPKIMQEIDTLSKLPEGEREERIMEIIQRELRKHDKDSGDKVIMPR